jgi:hypothetical protein
MEWVAAFVWNWWQLWTGIRTDPANPDLARRFKKHAPVLLADISDRDGWIALLDALETIDSKHIVVSLPAGLNCINEIQPLLRRTLEMLEIELRLFFCLSRQFDSIDLLGNSLDTGLAAIATQAIALKNGFFGPDQQFDRWYQSKQRAAWISCGNSEAYLQELNHRIVDHLECHPQPLHSLGRAGLSTALRIDLEDWLISAESHFYNFLPLSSLNIEGQHA